MPRFASLSVHDGLKALIAVYAAKSTGMLLRADEFGGADRCEVSLVRKQNQPLELELALALALALAFAIGQTAVAMLVFCR